MENTIEVPAEEYAELVTSKAYLDILIAVAHDPKNFMLSDIAGIVSDLLASRRTS